MKLDTKQLKTISILYVEDDEMIYKQTFDLFNKIFKKVYLAKDGVEGLEIFKEHSGNIDIIITDINMPKMNGLDMITNINKLKVQRKPVIITSAYTDSDFIINSIDLNVDKYITKPIQIKGLTIIIVNLVLQYRKSNKIESLTKDLIVKNNKDTSEKSKLSLLLSKTLKENEFYKSIVENYVCRFDTDKNGIIDEISPKFKRLFGYDNDDIIGENINSIKCITCNGESFQKMMLTAIHTKDIVLSTHSFTTKANKSILCDVSMSPKYGDDSLICGYTFYLDII